MRRHAFAPAMLVASLALIPAACSRESDPDRDRAETPAADPESWARLKGFTAVEATGPDNVVITRGDFSVRAEGEQKILDRLDIKVNGDTLEIGRKKRLGVGWSDDRGATIHVSLPAIRSVAATGSGEMSIDRADKGGFTAELTGSGNVKIAAANLDALKAEITGSGNLSVGGAAQAVDISIAGSGNFDGAALKTGRGEISILGSGDAGFASDGPVDISIMGSGDVTVKGKAQCRTTIMGSGEARCAP